MSTRDADRLRLLRSLELFGSLPESRLGAPKRLLGALKFRSEPPLNDAQRAEAARTLGAVARLLTAALQNVEHRNDEALRERLRNQSHGSNV